MKRRAGEWMAREKEEKVEIRCIGDRRLDPMFTSKPECMPREQRQEENDAA